MLSIGKMIVLAPALRAATVFSLKPPIRRTLPVTVNSPVIAMVGSSGLSNARESSDVAIVIPAEGPVLVSYYFQPGSGIYHLSELHPPGNEDASVPSQRTCSQEIPSPLEL